MEISVIICTKDRPRDFLECLDSLEVQTDKPDEVVVVDAFKIIKYFIKRIQVEK